MAEYFQSEYQYGAMVAETVYESWAKNNMQIEHHHLVGEMCREGFVLRLMSLLDVKATPRAAVAPSPQGGCQCLNR
jgi:hypothetical protein